jgi:ribosomal protein L40E
VRYNATPQVFVFNARQTVMAELPPDIMGMLSRGNLPDEDEFDDFMDQVSDRSTQRHSLAVKHFRSSLCLLIAVQPHVMFQVNEVERIVKGMADGNVDAKSGDEKTQKVLEKQRELERTRALKKEADARASAAAAKKKIEDDHRTKWGFYGMWCVRCRAEKKIDARTCDKCKSDLIDAETRQKQLLERVEEVKAERIARDIARDRWKRWKVDAACHAPRRSGSFSSAFRHPNSTSGMATLLNTMAR